MAPVPSPGPNRTSTAERAARVRFRRAASLLVMTLVVPGSAQLVAGDRRVGIVALRVWLTLAVAGTATVVTGFFDHSLAFRLASSPSMLLLLRLGLIAAAIGWFYLFVDAWRLGQPLTLLRQQRLAAVGINGVLSLAVAGVLLFSSHLVAVQRHLVLSMFSGHTVTGATDGRFNVLLVGGDSGAGRWGLRTDSMTVASIDAETGKTVLIGLPRNMTNFPFAPGSVMAKAWPKGFNCGYPNCELNGVNTWVGDHVSLFKGSKNPGMDATVSAVEGITGLKINYWVMVNLQGFKDLVDAVGGVTLNVRQPIPIGALGDFHGQYVPAGVHKLDGFETLWFARSRMAADDYSRMARQKCVMSAMLAQISPQTALTHFEAIANAGSAMVETSLPPSEAGRFMELALRAKAQKIATVSLVPPAINTGNPDLAKIRAMIAAAVAPASSPDPAAAKKHKPAPAQGLTGGSYGSMTKGYAANQSQDLAGSC